MTTPQGEQAALHSGNDAIEDGELVTEFPPPPYYYPLSPFLTPPVVPHEALERASMKALDEMKKKQEEAERNRLAVGGDAEGEEIGMVVGIGGDVPDFEKAAGGDDDEKNDVVAVFGEYVEDPLLAPEDDCADPRVVRDEMSRLNKEIILGFVKLVRDLVNKPVENKKSRDELSHNIFLLVQECNKFREHQARETFIEILETQLRDRKKALKALKDEIERTDDALRDFEQMDDTMDMVEG